MPKRKRAEPSPSTLPPERPSNAPASDQRALARQRKQCAARLTEGTKALLTALRHAATLERQKHSRRRKAAVQKHDDKAVERLDKEYIILKGLELQKVAEAQLKRTLGRVKSLSDSEGLPREWREDVLNGKEKEDAVSLNVKARLFKVPVVRNAVDEVIDDLKEIIGKVPKSVPHDDVDEVRKKVKTDMDLDTIESKEEASEGSEEGLEGALRMFDARIAAPSSAEDDSDASLSGRDRLPSVEDSDVESPDLEEDSESEAEDADMVDVASDSFENFDSEPESASDSEAIDLPISKAKVKAKAQAEDSAQRTSASTFLPSLSHAAYLSGSESEASDLDEKLAPKKNRRGQRARQAIWDKKYGEKAKHKQKEDRNKGWDPKRGAVDDKSGRHQRGARDNRTSGRGPERSGENAMPLGARRTKKDDSGPLHPSWAAAKAAKEKKMDMKPSGKKIVFD